MKRSRFTEEQVVKVVKAVEGGLPIRGCGPAVRCEPGDDFHRA